MTVHVYSSVSNLPPGYDALFNQASSASLFYSMPWFRNFLNTVDRGAGALRIYGIDRNGNEALPAAAVVMQEVGRALEAAQNYYSSLFGPILDPGEADVAGILRQFVDAVIREQPRWSSIDLHPMDRESQAFSLLQREFRAAGLIPFPYFCFGNWYLPVGGRSYKGYFESLSSQVRNTVKRKTKKLEILEGARIQIFTEGDSLERAIHAYVEIYNASWKVPEPHPRFMPGLIRVCAEQGWLRLGVVSLHDIPIAAQLWIVCGGKASIFKLAYKEEYAQLSAGTVLTARLMEQVIDGDGVSEIDYLTGDDSYKKDWMSHRRERWGLVVYNPRTIKGCLSIAKARTAHFWKTVTEARGHSSGPR